MSHRIMGGGASIVTSPTPKRTPVVSVDERINVLAPVDEVLARLVDAVSRHGDIYTPMDVAQVEVCIKPCKLYLWGMEDGPDLCRRITLWYDATSDLHILRGEVDALPFREVRGSRHDVLAALTSWVDQDALVWREKAAQLRAAASTPA